MKKYIKITFLSVLCGVLIFDIYIKLYAYVNDKINFYKLEGFNIALKEVSDAALKNGGVELFVKNSDGSTTKLNLILEKKK